MVCCGLKHSLLHTNIHRTRVKKEGVLPMRGSTKASCSTKTTILGVPSSTRELMYKKHGTSSSHVPHAPDNETAPASCRATPRGDNLSSVQNHGGDGSHPLRKRAVHPSHGSGRGRAPATSASALIPAARPSVDTGRGSGSARCTGEVTPAPTVIASAGAAAKTGRRRGGGGGGGGPASGGRPSGGDSTRL